MDFTQSMDNGYMIPTSVAVGSGEATDIRCVCDTVEDFKTFLDTTDMELRYEGLVTYEKVNKLLKVYKGNDTWQTVGEGGENVDTSSFITLTQLSQQLSNYYTKAQADNKISEEIAKAQLGGSGEVDLSAYATKKYVDDEISKIELKEGPQGPQGLKGDKGDKGDVGPQGPAGTVDTSEFYNKEEVDGKDKILDDKIDVLRVEISDILKRLGILEEGGIIVPDPENTMPSIKMYGDFTKLTSSASEIELDRIILEDIKGEIIFDKKGLCSLQGNTSLQFPEKNYSIDLKNEDGTKYKFKPFDDVEENDGYHLKANWVDGSHARNIATVNIAKSIRKTELPTGARGVIDGFPCLVYLNDEKHGVYTFNLKQHGSTVYGMDKSNPNHLIYRCESNVAGMPTSFRSLSTDNTESGASNKDFEDRFPKTATEENRAKLNRLIQWVMDCEGDAEKFKNEIDNYLHKEYLIDYWIISNVFCMGDSLAKNMNFATYDGLYWYPLFYDCDASWGTKWNGTKISFNSELLNVENQTGISECKDSLLWELVTQAFDTEIKERYAELRKDKFTKDNLIAEVKKITDNIPQSEYDFDATKWSEKPSLTAKLDYMTTWIDNRLGYMDSYFAHKNEVSDINKTGLHAWFDFTESGLSGNTVIGKTGYGSMTLNNFTHDNNTNGFIGGGLQFNGSNTYAEIPLTFNNDDMTIQVLFTKDEFETGKYHAIATNAKAGSSTNNGFDINLTPTKLQAALHTSVASYSNLDDVTGKLCCVTLCKKGNVGTIYTNERLVRTFTISEVNNTPLGDKIVVGRNSGNNTNYGKFNLKHIIVYDRELSMSEVLDNYNALNV